MDIRDKVTLIQTDTTVGFLSANSKKLSDKKQRPANKPYIQVVHSLYDLSRLVRVPKRFRRMVRLSKRTTFVYKNRAIRVIGKHKHFHSKFVQRYSPLFSTSANISGKRFSKEEAEKRADIICEEPQGFSENMPSAIYKIGRKKIIKIR